MKNFNHKNVLHLIGVSFDQNDGLPMLVIPYMHNGNLLDFLRNAGHDFIVKDLVTFGFEIASGMEYLASQKFIHRDLAARNCMLDDHLHVKIADFGLAKDVYERNYYKSDRRSEMPIKWMAPESLEHGEYYEKSDVWSFGVTLWEIMTRGVTPYPGVNHWEIAHHLKSSGRLGQPDYCPQAIFEVMQNCWFQDPNARPTFDELLLDLHLILEQTNAEMDILDYFFPLADIFDMTPSVEKSVVELFN